MAKKDKVDYFEIFAKQAEFAVQEADLLIRVIEEFDGGDRVLELCERCHRIENQGDQLNHRLFEAVAVDFITPFDREDILGIAQNLDDVLDCIEDILRSFYMYDVQVMRSDAAEFAHIIKDSCKALKQALDEFANFKKSKDLRDLIVKVDDFEEAGDRLYFKMMHDLYANNRDNPIHVIIWSHIYKGMEACCDECEHVADTMSAVLLKNS